MRGLDDLELFTVETYVPEIVGTGEQRKARLCFALHVGAPARQFDDAFLCCAVRSMRACLDALEADIRRGDFRAKCAGRAAQG